MEGLRFRCCEDRHRLFRQIFTWVERFWRAQVSGRVQPAFLVALLAQSSTEHESMWLQLLSIAFSKSLPSFDFLDTTSLGGQLAALNALTQPVLLQSALVRAQLEFNIYFDT